MKTTLILPSGYSPVLENLLEIAKKVRFEFKTEHIVLLGGLLNANPVKKELKQLGIDIIDIPYLGFSDFIKHLDKDTIVLTSPYGCDESILNTLKKENFRFYETLSSTIKNKLDFINKSKGKCKIIYVGNTYSIEANYISICSKFSYIFYDVNDASKAKSIITPKKFNNKKTHILFQSEIIGSNFDASKKYLKEILPDAIFEEELSDENYKRRIALEENCKDGDIVLFVSDTNRDSKYILDYYQLSTKNLLYAIVKDLNEVMNIKFPSDKHILLISDGSLPESIVNSIYQYLSYKQLWENAPGTR